MQSAAKLIRAIGWLAVPLFIVLILPLINLAFLHFRFGPEEAYGVIGGPENVPPLFGNIDEATVAGGSSPEGEDAAAEENEIVGFLVSGAQSFINLGSPIMNAVPSRDGVVAYRVQEGDTLSHIAATFGISINTIYWSNNLSTSMIKPGDELLVLPVSGVMHVVSEGDTLAGIAKKYSADEGAISTFNKVTGVLQPGQKLIVPGGVIEGRRLSLAQSKSSALPSYPGYYSMPTTGWNWGRLHSNNAVDIANSCGTPIYAAAEGLVVEAADSGWNYGYGKYVKLEHPNGTKTFYAHVQSISAEEGDFVQQGELIATIGNTGKTHGPTGCHLHFEVHGARNPFAK